jgi:hypothetical protein
MVSSTLKIAPGSYVNSGDTHLIFLYRSAGITFRDIGFDGNRQNAAFPDEQSHCVETWSSSEVVFERVLFRNCWGDGIRLMGLGSPGDPWTEGVTIQDSRFEDNGRSGIAVQRGVRDLKVLRNLFQRISDQSIDIEPTGSVSPTDVLIEDNVVHHSTGNWAIAIGGIGGGDVARRFVFRNNRIENGSVLIYKAHDVTVEGNVILGDPYHGAGLRLTHDMANVQILNNRITSPSTNVGDAGIQIVSLNEHYPQAVTVRNNVVATKSGGVMVRDASLDITIEDNSLSGAGGSTGVLVTNVISRGFVHSGFTINRNLVNDFAVGVSLATGADLFSDVTIQDNTIDHDQTPPTSTTGLLFDKTGPYQEFADITPNAYGAGIQTEVAVRTR